MRLINVTLWSVAGVYLAVRVYFRNPSPEIPWATPYLMTLLSALAFFVSFKLYRERNVPAPRKPQREPATRTERLIFRALGVMPILAGMALIGVGGWLACGLWDSVAHWPRTDAILVRKEILQDGARLVFDYEARGRRFTSVAFRWGFSDSVRAALQTYEPGTVQRISYDPRDPAHIETLLSYSWELFRAPVGFVVIGSLFVLGGRIVGRLPGAQ